MLVSAMLLLRKVSVLAGAVFLAASVIAEEGVIQDNAGMGQSYVLSDFSEFTSVAATADFNIWDEIIWTIRLMFNKPAFGELVVLYGYPLENVCQEESGLKEASLRLKRHGGFIMQAAETLAQANDPAVAFNVQEYEKYTDDGVESEFELAGLLADICRYEKTGDLLTMIKSDSVGWMSVDQSGISKQLATDLYGISSKQRVLLTASPVLELDEATQVWARCNVRNPDTLGSVCKATLAASPYASHQELATRIRQGSPNI